MTKLRVVLFGLVIVSCLLGVSCSSPQNMQIAEIPQNNQDTLRNVAALVVPLEIAPGTTNLTVYVCGFKPEESVVLKVQGHWLLKVSEVIDPPIAVSGVNKYQTADLTFRLDQMISLYKIQPGTYTLIAEQEKAGLVANAPLIIKQPKK